MSERFSGFLLLAALLQLAVVGGAQAQSTPSRFGVGFNTLISSGDGFGIGVRGRMARPVNEDVSLAADVGLSGFVLEGRSDASYLVDLQGSVIVTGTGSGPRIPYFLGGVAAYIPVGKGAKGGPALHGGMGWVQPLAEAAIFYEVNPALVIGESSLSVIVPFRIGIIF